MKTSALSRLLMGLVALLLVHSRAICEAVDSEAPARVLIVTGEDHRAHDWQSTTPVLRRILQQDWRLQIDVLNDLSKLEQTDLKPFHCVVIHFKNYHPEVPGRVAFEHLQEHVRDGVGLVLVHFACGAFEEFKAEYEQMVGRVWIGPGPKPPLGRRHHDPRGPFNVTITDAQHPITAGMTSFGTDDELYTCLEGDAEVTVLATATSKLDGKSHPMALVHKYGQGRVFNCTLGHDVRALLPDEVGELYRRGCAWSAGLTPISAGKP